VALNDEGHWAPIGERPGLSRAIELRYIGRPFYLFHWALPLHCAHPDIKESPHASKSKLTIDGNNLISKDRIVYILCSVGVNSSL
jgi:hypothetical protein